MKKLYRSNNDKKIAGICGGISEMTNIDSSVIRIIFVFLFILTGFFPLGFTYILAWMIFPIKYEN